MNKLLLLTFLLIGVVACKYDDEALWNKVNSLDDRVTSIEGKLTQMNSDINAISVLVNALQNKVYVESVTEIENGYQIAFIDGKTVVIGSQVATTAIGHYANLVSCAGINFSSPAAAALGAISCLGGLMSNAAAIADLATNRAQDNINAGSGMIGEAGGGIMEGM